MGDYYSHTSPHSYNYSISDIVVRINKEKLKIDMRESAKVGLVLGNVREKGSDQPSSLEKVRRRVRELSLDFFET